MADPRTAARAPLVGAGLSSHQNGLTAVRAALDSALGPLEGHTPDLVCVFIAPQFEPEQRAMLDHVVERVGGGVVLGCLAGGVIGGSVEVEDAPAVSVWAAALPGGVVRPFRLTFQREDEHAVIEGLDEIPAGESDPVLVLIADGYSFPADLLLDHLNDAAPGVPVVGGMASAGLEAGRNSLYLDDDIFHDGAVGVIVTGVGADAFVSQGCRPVGETYAVTRSEQNVIFELGGVPAMRRVEEMFAGATERDQLLMRRGLHVGQAIDELKPEQRQGDFLVRNVVGIDPASGAIAIGDMVEVGQTVQFQVRDAESARADLRVVLERDRELNGDDIAGVLLFSCNGRGQALFGQPGHDIGAVRRAYGSVPVAGFFAAGEFGPVGQRNFLHGFTASMLVVRRGRDQD
ncbi:MAG TPA: FIST N-terminal domain-containing protein [Candidatus Limnocylindria bacterium]|nr:FIST N-terminal domain-containing protein [Candidatus Limnocylindria bacterium]